MTFWQRSALVDATTSDWIFACFEWLLCSCGGFAEFRDTPLVLPTHDYFPAKGLNGHALASDVFERVREQARMTEWKCQLVPQAAPLPRRLTHDLHIARPGEAPAGTFQWTGEAARITYSPDLLARPEHLIATFAHELAHYLVGSTSIEPPGGVEYLEGATDVAATFLGFGIFLANAAFHFEQLFDEKTGLIGWQAGSAGYLSEREHAFALAVFLALTDRDHKEAAPFLDANPRSHLKRATRDLGSHSAKLDALRRLEPAHPT